MPKSTTLTVMAAHSDRPVFQEGKGRIIREGVRVFLIGSSPVEVPNTRYYQRRIVKGDLVIVSAAPAESKAKATKKEG